MTIQNLNKYEKAYIVWRFVLELHNDDRFTLAQRPLKKIVGWIRKSSLYPYLKNISIYEFVKLSENILDCDPDELGLSLKGIKSNVDPNLIHELKEIIANAEKNKTR